MHICVYANNKRIIVKHIGSAHTDDELVTLRNEAERVREGSATHAYGSFELTSGYALFCA